MLVYLQIAIHINAVGLGAMTLLGHATWLLAQLLLSVAPRREDSIDGQKLPMLNAILLFPTVYSMIYIDLHTYKIICVYI